MWSEGEGRRIGVEGGAAVAVSGWRLMESRSAVVVVRSGYKLGKSGFTPGSAGFVERCGLSTGEPCTRLFRDGVSWT